MIIATVVAFLLSFLDRRDRMGPSQVWEALVAGARGVLPIAATTAAAGIIVAVVSLTGLGLKLSGLIVDLAGGSLALTAIFAAIAVLILGLAVPVTASFIIAAAVVAPALVALGVEDFAAYMFIFYYAVLSEVSPPTALRPSPRPRSPAATASDDDADLPLHAAGVPRPVRVRALAEGRRPAAAGRRGDDRVRRSWSRSSP